MPRPLLGILKFSDGTEALLDRPLIIGRSPRAERVSSKEIPQLVSLSSPDQNISRNHLEIRIDGWHVIVVDLESVNGTVVTNPGQAPELLRAGEEVPIVPGAVVSIADEITFIYEVAQ
jgi:pSer/pThr/pTyr-binding forkhead associated (FHA) protein